MKKTSNHPQKRRLPLWMTRVTFVAGGLIVLLMIIVSLFPAVFAPYDPLEVAPAARFIAPCVEHPFGTDFYGRDILSRVVYGARIDLLIGVLGTAIPLVVGSILGLLAGYYGGLLDSLLMRVNDVMMAFPFTILVIIIMTILGQGMQNIFIALWLVGWMSYARLVRSEVLVMKNAEFVQSAVVAGFTNARILFRHVLPNVISSAVVFAASDIVMCMITGASMSFLGLGIQPPSPEWGAILNEGRGYISTAWWITFFPGLTMALTGVGFSLLGDGLSDFLRTKGR
ncbi:MAG: ABC transporter permease [Oscillospiraceae bacterium]|jgi:peptide/nickel transport system permease protein|nr:ABC transporter permease [Oscillospiraceae bacterium]